jgi:hypothetical protein
MVSEGRIGSIVVPILDVPVDQGDCGGQHSDVIREADNNEHIRDHIDRQNKVTECSQQDSPDTKGRFAIRRAII